MKKEIDEIFDVLVPGFLGHPILQGLLDNGKQFLIHDAPLLADMVLGSFFSDVCVNPLRHSRDRWEKVVEDYPSFKKHGMIFMMWAKEYYQQRAQNQRPF